MNKLAPLLHLSVAVNVVSVGSNTLTTLFTLWLVINLGVAVLTHITAKHEVWRQTSVLSSVYALIAQVLTTVLFINYAPAYSYLTVISLLLTVVVGIQVVRVMCTKWK